VGAEYVKTSTGYGFVKGSDGKYSYEGATEHDLKLMLAHVGPGVKVKAAGGVRTLDGLLKVKAMGVVSAGCQRYRCHHGRCVPAFRACRCQMRR
jgi:deoxyribose-phosphate aldolase